MHLIRNSLDYATWKDRKALSRSCGRSNTAATEAGAEAAPKAVAASSSGARYRTAVESWRRAWKQVISFFAFPSDVRRVSG